MQKPVPHSAEVFNQVAGFYNEYFSKPTNDGLLPLVEELLLKELLPNCRILDVCCGNGHMVKAFRERGFLADGLDAAAEMLKYAKQLVPTADFSCQNALTFKVTKPYPVLTAFGYAINHCCMTGNDLNKLFKALYKALTPGGVLLFDLAMEETIEDTSLGSFEIKGDNHYLASTGKFLDDEKKALINVEMEGLESSNHINRKRSISFYQRCFSIHTIETTLKKVGFIQVELFDANRNWDLPKEVGPRFFVKTRRPA